MNTKEAKKVLDDLKYDPAKGTRRLDPESRLAAKAALNALGRAGEVYTKKKKAPKKAPKAKPLEAEE